MKMHLNAWKCMRMREKCMRVHADTIPWPEVKNNFHGFDNA